MLFFPGELENFPGANNVLKHLDSENEAPTPYRERGVLGRMAITGLLTLTLLGAIRWAAGHYQRQREASLDQSDADSIPYGIARFKRGGRGTCAA